MPRQTGHSRSRRKESSARLSRDAESLPLSTQSLPTQSLSTQSLSTQNLPMQSLPAQSLPLSTAKESGSLAAKNLNVFEFLQDSSEAEQSDRAAGQLALLATDSSSPAEGPDSGPACSGACAGPDCSGHKSHASKEEHFDLSVPESYYYSVSVPHALPPSPPRSPEGTEHRQQRGRHKKGPAKPFAGPKPAAACSPTPASPSVSSGYGFIAAHLGWSSEHARLPPLYRRFETVNHRVLLHLQDEIAQLEEDLELLDQQEEMHRAAAAAAAAAQHHHQRTKPMPASRRLEVQAQPYSLLHYRRQDLMNALIRKTEQYNSALSAYSRVLRSLPRAAEPDIAAYRAWMQAKSPIVPAEARFLDHADDLVCLAAEHDDVRLSSNLVLVVVCSAAILLPLSVFSAVTSLTGRLVVVTVGGAAATAATTPDTDSTTGVCGSSRDARRYAYLYFGLLTVIAVFAS